ncbi:MAG: ATP-binding cassette domain-containing protein [Succinivibrionaceae bacterium]|nr:ATP-binding cassette domain-containing protein [Succinivibrionaceae bacterium]
MASGRQAPGINFVVKPPRLVLSDTSKNPNTSFIRSYRQFWPFVRPLWFWLLLGIALTIPVGALDAVVASFLKPFMDQAMIEQQREFVIYVPCAIVGFSVLQGILIYVSAIVNGWVGGKVGLNMKLRLFDRLLSFDTTFYDLNNSGSVMFRFATDAQTASGQLIGSMKLFLTRFFSSASLICVMVYQSWHLTLVSVGALVFLFLPMRIVRRRIKKIIGRTVVSNSSLLTLYNETTAGNRVIKAFNLQDFTFRRFTENSERLFRLDMKLIRDTNWLSPVMHLVATCVVAGVLYFGLGLIVSGVLTPGAFVAFLAALIMLYTPLKSIGNNFISIQQAMLALDRIYEILDTHTYEDADDSYKQSLPPLHSAVEFRDVDFSYSDGRKVLSGVSFTARAGTKVALVGNSGGGKSTICALIPRLYEIDGGAIYIDGQDIRDVTLASLRSQIAMVFQDSFMFEGSIRDNLACGKEGATEEEMWAALGAAYLKDFVRGLPEGLDTHVGEQGASLSGGQRQRLAIARAILKDAPLVILDEATSALDSKSEHIVQKALDRLMHRRTTLVIAHRLSTIRDADLILVVNDGRIVERGRHEDLLARNGAYATLYNSQFQRPVGSEGTEAILLAEEAARLLKEEIGGKAHQE